jgi:hypothetical protein
MRYLSFALLFLAINCSGQEKPIVDTSKSFDLQPVIVQQPIVTTKTTKSDDSTYFSINIFNDRFEAKILNKKLVAKNYIQIDEFIKKNKSIIDPNKILIIGNSKAPYERFKSILEVFKKYNYYKFQLLTK